ncbi:MAG: hypothetical protein HC836_27840 [Richelia sp. RM2_1_2]|nr:hypothetical protein [Richelia sp. RM2_1_2]
MNKKNNNKGSGQNAETKITNTKTFEILHNVVPPIENLMKPRGKRPGRKPRYAYGETQVGDAIRVSENFDAIPENEKGKIISSCNQQNMKNKKIGDDRIFKFGANEKGEAFIYVISRNEYEEVKTRRKLQASKEAA